MKIAVVSASLGGMDASPVHDVQTISYDNFYFTDENFPLRDKVMTPRLQAKIPKMFGWQLVPDYDYYLWLDGNIRLNRPDVLEYFYNEIQGHDIVVLKHHRRNTIKWETRYMERALNEQSTYIVSRYGGEFWKEQKKEFENYKDDRLYIGGIFMYRNIPKIHEAMKEWWYQVSRYCVQDQISFPYAFRDVRVKVLDHDYRKWEMIKMERHNKRNE